ncbi:MAG TPA: hypothetical protein VFF33_09125 [Ignavibacteriaceae bacterium]|nr:hypothetical protein [Ignavibacteriaceae bacterium]
MQIILDITGSFIVAGIFVLLMLNLKVYENDNKYSSDSELSLQSHAKTLAEIVNYDLRKIGFKHAGTDIIVAQNKKLSFYADIDSNNVMDIVTYQLSDSLKMLETENPRDKILYRIVNNDTSTGSSLGLVNLNFIYRTSSGAIATALDSIKYIEAEMWVETLNKVKDKYPFTYWELTINPRNL